MPKDWTTDATAEREHIPAWLVNFSQLWAADSAAHYPQEFQEIKRLAKSANVPPWALILKMFKETYQVTPEMSEEEFHQKVAKKMEADGGELVVQMPEITSFVPPTIEKETFIKQLEERVEHATQAAQNAINAHNERKYQEALQDWGQAQELWLIVAQEMTPAKARAFMVGFATNGELSKWMEEDRAGPPPTVFSLFQ